MILRIFKKQGADNGSSVHGSTEKKCAEVREKKITKKQGILDGSGDVWRKGSWVLVPLSIGVMVP